MPYFLACIYKQNYAAFSQNFSILGSKFSIKFISYKYSYRKGRSLSWRSHFCCCFQNKNHILLQKEGSNYCRHIVYSSIIGKEQGEESASLFSSRVKTQLARLSFFSESLYCTLVDSDKKKKFHNFLTKISEL